MKEKDRARYPPKITPREITKPLLSTLNKETIIKRKDKSKMNKKANERVRAAMKRCRLFTWQVADLLNVSENTVYIRLRHELPKEEQDRIIALIEKHSAERSAGNG